METANLKCACCGARTIGRQFNNQDKGWGLCNNCATRISGKYSPYEMESVYGKAGFHYSIEGGE